MAIFAVQLATATYASAAGTAPKFTYEAGPSNTLGQHSVTDMWRDVRQGKAGVSTAYRAEDGVLINANGSWWAQLREKTGLLVKAVPFY